MLFGLGEGRTATEKRADAATLLADFWTMVDASSADIVSSLISTTPTRSWLDHGPANF